WVPAVAAGSAGAGSVTGWGSASAAVAGAVDTGCLPASATPPSSSGCSVLGCSSGCSVLGCSSGCPASACAVVPASSCVAAGGGPDSVTAALSTAAAAGSSSAGRGVCCSLNGHSFDGDGKGRLLGALDGTRRAD